MLLKRLFVMFALMVGACGGGSTTTAVAAPATVAGTTLTPSAPPICGEFGRPYLAPGSTGMMDPVLPPPGLGVLDERTSRIYVEGDLSDAYSQEDQDLIANGRARPGLDERSVYLANGLPAFYWNTEIGDSRCRILLYGVLGEPNIDTAIYTCENEVIHIGPVQPRLPCWRVAEVAPRAIEAASHFDSAGVERQWDILYGLLQRGQSMEDVGISFGVPYRTGTEAREDGTDAANHVYLDNSGDAYATYLTFVGRELRGWRFPPDRRLTAEAEQRRLDALERRMVDQMREMERASIARHQAELAHLNTIQQNQEQIRADIANARTAVLDHVSTEAGATRGTVRNQGARTRQTIAATPQHQPATPRGQARGQRQTPRGRQPTAQRGSPSNLVRSSREPLPAGHMRCRIASFSERRNGSFTQMQYSDWTDTGIGTECRSSRQCHHGLQCSNEHNRCLPPTSAPMRCTPGSTRPQRPL